MSRFPKSEIRKRKLPDGDQVDYFRLGYTSIFNAQSFQEQFLEFWHNLPASFRDDEDEDDLHSQPRRAALFEQNFSLNEDEFKHNLVPLSGELCTDDLITATPHCLIRQKINHSVQHYMKINHDKQQQQQQSSSQPPFRKRRRLSHGLDAIITNDSGSVSVSASTNDVKMEQQKETPLLKGSRGRRPQSVSPSNRRRNRNKKSDKRITNRPHVLFAANVEMTFYDQLIVPFDKFQERRMKHKLTQSKKEVNSVTKLTRNHKLHEIENSKGCKLMRENECILKLAIFQSNKSSERYTKSHEYLVLSTQKLSDIKDALYCLMDKTPIAIGKDIKNSYFFIEDTFYDDTRHSNYCRLSQEIIDWSRSNEHWKQTGVYLQKDMQNIEIKELNIRLGSHYLYVHQGDCQHVIVFTECRISTKTDCSNCNAYPMTVYRQILKRQKCGICEMYPAKYVTYGDKLTTHNPFFFCQRCYYPFHYNKNGKLLYDDFQVFNYIHD